ncbi:MAG: adenylate kinase [Chlamydiae bacterium]|nr:adenylate kinase [Chlamydiota bacterium]
MVSLTSLSIAAQVLEAKEQENQPLTLILLGPPGAGKGTQATMLSSALGIPHISTGNLLRAHAKEGTEAKRFMDQGKLVPDSLVIDMLFNRVALEDCQKGYILDGFPRTLAQAKALHLRLPSSSKTIILNLELSDQTIVGRLTQRLVCSRCSAPFHLKHAPPQQEGLCDRCHGELKERSDDREEVILKRLTLYHNLTEPLIAYYSKEENFKTISCDQPIENVLGEILNTLREVYSSFVEIKA